DKFSSIKIYFGNEAESISKFNVTSTPSHSNLTFSQTVGETTLADKAAIHTAAAKRFSIVFETASDAFVFYFGQGKITESGSTKQVTKPVIIPQTILTVSTNFVETIQAINNK
ncbi:MAG: hypothetical protein RSE26_02795, partial [Malacoplasma sp.]